MRDRRGSVIDRRWGKERRGPSDPDYFLKGGIERRNGKERRSTIERRAAWKRVSDHYSVLPWTSSKFTNP